jgi:hypothetical protein
MLQGASSPGWDPRMKNGTPSVETEFEQWLILALEYERERMREQSTAPKERSVTASPQAATHQGQ